MAEGSPIRTDVIVVGSGAVGVAAGIEAKEAGARVIILEREPTLGGAAVISGGGCCIVGTSLQMQNGIEDTTDLAFQDWIAFGGGSADEKWARFYIENSCHELFQWASDRGGSWVSLNRNEGNVELY